MYSQSKNWLFSVFSELRRPENANWVKQVDLIENTTVPVIKMQCQYFPDTQKLTLPNGNLPRYPHIVERPINIDISLMTENHNGLNCVNLVKQYLKENSLI